MNKALRRCIKQLKRLLAKGEPINESDEEILVNQVDALVDLLYFVYGSFVLLGVDPDPMLKIVHQANMGKLFPDGQPHYDEITHKVLKPKDWAEKYAPEGKIREELEKQKHH